jgi:hypothetical protein
MMRLEDIVGIFVHELNFADDLHHELGPDDLETALAHTGKVIMGAVLAEKGLHFDVEQQQKSVQTLYFAAI